MCKRICGHFISLLMSSTIQLLMNKRILVALSLQLGLLLMVIGNLYLFESMVMAK